MASSLLAQKSPGPRLVPAIVPAVKRKPQLEAMLQTAIRELRGVVSARTSAHIWKYM